MESRSVKFSSGHIDQLLRARTPREHLPPSKVKRSQMHLNPTKGTQGESQGASAVAGISIRSATISLTRYDQIDGLQTIKSRKKSIRSYKTLQSRAKSNGPSGTEGRRGNSLSNRMDRRSRELPLPEP
jgi:hypothetical protein